MPLLKLLLAFLHQESETDLFVFSQLHYQEPPLCPSIVVNSKPDSSHSTMVVVYVVRDFTVRRDFTKGSDFNVYPTGLTVCPWTLFELVAGYGGLERFHLVVLDSR